MIHPPIIIFRLGSLGDTIVALPCFHAVRARFPRNRIIILTNVPVSTKAAPLLAVLGGEGQFVDDLIEYPISLRSIVGIISLVRSIRATGARTLVFLMPRRSWRQAWRDWIFFKLACGMNEILCFPTFDDLRNTRVDSGTGEIEREAARLIRTCAALGPIDIEDRANWDLKLTDAEKQKATELIAPLSGLSFIAVNMGGKAVEKDWGIANWEALCAQLLTHGRFGLLVVGTQQDYPSAQRLISQWMGLAVNACGMLSPRESGAAIAAACLFIGHDSGPLHLAAALGTPTIGLFGDLNRPKEWHPVGQTVRIIHRMDGLDKITSDEVMLYVKELLATGKYHQ